MEIDVVDRLHKIIEDVPNEDIQDMCQEILDSYFSSEKEFDNILDCNQVMDTYKF